MENKNKGFYIKELKIVGKGKKDATLSFTKGCNLISGPSDSGKSFAFSIINFMLGKTDPPIGVPEGEGYSGVYMQINTYDNDRPYTIYRKLNEKKCTVKQCLIYDFTNSSIKSNTYSLSAKNTYSLFFLQLCGLDNVVLRKSQYSKANLLYSYIRKLTLISESRITTTDSPFYPTGQYSDQPLYQSLFFYLLTGQDFSNFTPIDKEDIRKSKINGKIEFINERIEKIGIRINSISDLKNDKIDLDSQLSILEADYEKLINQVSSYSTQKEKLIKELEAEKSLYIYHSELIERLNLLMEHYKSDFARLDFIHEGQVVLNQLNTIECPFCESPLGENGIQKIESDVNLQKTIAHEKNNLYIKEKDLQSTINSNIQECGDLTTRINNLKDAISNIDQEIKEIFSPSIDNLANNISAIKGSISVRSQIDYLNKELEFYIKERTEQENSLKNKQISEGVSFEGDDIKIKEFYKILRAILKAWNYPNYEKIIFDPNNKVFDFVFTGKARKAYGKGLRSVSYTAIMIALLEYCIEQDIPNNRLLVIDSPLTAYHGVEEVLEEDKLDPNIENSFFEYFSQRSLDFQLIIFDNKSPNKELKGKIHHERFTKNSHNGRYGLFPEIE